MPIVTMIVDADYNLSFVVLMILTCQHIQSKPLLSTRQTVTSIGSALIRRKLVKPIVVGVLDKNNI